MRAGGRAGLWKQLHVPQGCGDYRAWPAGGVSRPAQAIEAALIICPVMITECRKASGQGTSPNRCPRRMLQIGADFHDHQDIRGPLDAEAEAGVPNGEIGHAHLDIRVPENDRRTGPVWTPTAGSRQMINGRHVAALERIHTNTRRVALEVDSPQTGARIERPAREAGNTAWDRYIRETHAVEERIFPNACDTARDRDVGQAVAEFKRPLTDAVNVAPYGDAGEPGAVRKRPELETGDAVAYNCISQAGIGKRCAETGHAVWDNYTAQGRAASKRIVSDDDNAVGYINAA